MQGKAAPMQAISNEQLAQIQVEAVAARAANLKRPLEILEAGCGRKWLLDLAGIEYTLTGVDLDPEALRYRIEVTHDLDVGIHGDICSATFQDATFDVIYSCYVLEHVQRAEIALMNFARWLKPGGLLILRIPERDSVRGFVTRLTPHAFHVWYYRYILGVKWAGQPGRGPYPTFFNPSIGAGRLPGFLDEQGLVILSCHSDGFNNFRSETSRRVVRYALVFITKVISKLSLGRLSGDYAEVLYIAVKRERKQDGSRN